jgi:hypothetical protein
VADKRGKSRAQACSRDRSVCRNVLGHRAIRVAHEHLTKVVVLVGFCHRRTHGPFAPCGVAAGEAGFRFRAEEIMTWIAREMGVARPLAKAAVKAAGGLPTF